MGSSLVGLLASRETLHGCGGRAQGTQCSVPLRLLLLSSGTVTGTRDSRLLSAHSDQHTTVDCG